MSIKFLFNKKFLIPFFIFIVLLAVIISGCLFVIKKVEDINFIKSFLYEKYNLVLECSEIKGGFRGLNFNVESPDILIKAEQNSDPFVDINDFRVEIKVLPLLIKKLSISDIEASYIGINLKRDEKGVFDFSKYIKIQKKPFFKLDLADSKAEIGAYGLKFSDLFTKTNFELSGFDLKSLGLDKNGKFNLYTTGNIKVNDKISNYLVDIDYVKNKNSMKLNRHEVLISAFDTSFLKKYLYNQNVTSTDSVVDIYSSAAGEKDYKLTVFADKVNLAFDYKGEKNKIQTKGPVIFENVYNFKDKVLTVQNGSLNAKGVNVQYSGTIKNLFSLNEIEPNLDIKITDTNLQDFITLIPDTVIPFQEPYVQSIKKYNANAIINGSAKFKFKDIDNFSVKGKLNFDDVYVVERPKDAKTSFGECEFLGRDVIITVYANAPRGSILTVVGKTRMQKMPYAEFSVKSTGKLDLAFAHKILMPVRKILNLKLGPLPFMTLKGNGTIELHTKGTKEKANLEGFFETNDATVTMNGLNTVLTNGKVKVVFDKDKILFNNAQGLIEGAKTKIDGNCDTSGNLLVDVFVENIQATKAIKIAETSEIVTAALDGGEFLKSFQPNSGKLDFYLNLSGNVPPDAVFGEQSDSILAKGKLVFKGINLNVVPKIKGTNLKGTLTFENDAKFDLTADIFDSPFKINGKVYQKGSKNKIQKGVPSTLDIQFISDNVSSDTVGRFILENIELFAPQNRLFATNLGKIFTTNKFLLKGDVKTSGLIYSNATELDLSGFDFDGNIYGVNKKGSDFYFKEGNIELKGKNAKFNNLNLNAAGIHFSMDGTIRNFASNKPNNSLKLIFYNSPFENYLKLFIKILPEKTAKFLKTVQNPKGNVSGRMKLNGDKIDGEFLPDKVSLYDAINKREVSIQSGKIKFKNEKTLLSAFNILYGTLPLYIDGFMQTDGRVNPEFNIFVSTNLTEGECDSLINPYLKYPVQLDGEASIKARLLGNLDSYTSYFSILLNEGSDMSFMGLKLGDTKTKREISSKIKFNGSYANINYIKYFKYILSQSNKQTIYELINVSGGVKLSKGNITFNNLKFFTPNPAPVRFLNLLFKKSLIKEGLFTSDLVLNGDITNLSAKGKLNFSKVFVPIYESFIDNIEIVLNDKLGHMKFKLSAFNTTGDIEIDFVNKVTYPIVINNVVLHFESVSINNLLKSFAAFANSATPMEGDIISSNSNNLSIKPEDVLVKKGSLIADEIDFNGIIANNLKMNFSHNKEASLKIDDAYLSIAGGLIKGIGSYNFNSKDIFVKSDFMNCEADELTKAFFNLSGQLYGNANGTFTISMKDFTLDDYVRKINATAEFAILNGRMPKLGSIEYLLRASNFIKSGIFGLTINNVIELLTPYKHGDFNKIKGDLKVSDAKIQDLKIYSQGDNLSTYTFGSYDILNGVGDIEILGKLSKKISNILGPVGNTSVVSILNMVTRNKMDELVKTEMLKNVNKIPLMDLNNDDYRLFNAKIEGAATADNIVKSFTWLN